jgi:hypothetical protein
MMHIKLKMHQNVISLNQLFGLVVLYLQSLEIKIFCCG